MFVRIRKQPGKDRLIPYAYLVDNHWNPIRKKNEQKIIASLGRLEHIPVDGTIEKIITALDTFATRMGFASLANGVVLSDISRETLLGKSLDWGSILLSRHVLSTLSFESSIRGLLEGDKNKKVTTETVVTATTALLAHRLSARNDASERSTHQWYTTKVFTADKKLLTDEDFYRSLDALIAHKDEIEKAYYEQNRNLFNGALDLVLFDTTSIYYWGASDPTMAYSETDLLQYGFSKDGKGNLKQLIVGVLMTSDGVPIAHEVFKGNTADVTAFRQILTVIKEKYRVNKVILIADRGMVSQENLVHLEQSGFSYIVGIRMRQLAQELKNKLLVPLDDEDKRYELFDMDKVDDTLYVKEFPVSTFSEEEINELFVKKILTGKTATFSPQVIREAVKKRRFFVCLNPLVKQATAKKREYFTRIIRQKINKTPAKDWIVKNGYKKYLKFEKGLSPTIDYDRLRDEQIYDGKWIIMTNEKDISSYMAGSYYKTLQTIERGFRDLKSLITVQPIFHWKEERIRAHIFVCFLSLVMKWYICRSLNKYSQKDGRRFIEALVNLKAIAIDENIPLYVRTEINPETQQAMKQLKMIVPAKVIIDGRRKVNAPIGPKGGRPRKNRSPGQLGFNNQSHF